MDDLHSSASVVQCDDFSYDQSEFWDTAVTENNWVCDKVTSLIGDQFSLFANVLF